MQHQAARVVVLVGGSSAGNLGVARIRTVGDLRLDIMSGMPEQPVVVERAVSIRMVNVDVDDVVRKSSISVRKPVPLSA